MFSECMTACSAKFWARKNVVTYQLVFLYIFFKKVNITQMSTVHHFSPSCQGHWTQEQQSTLKTAKNTVEIHSVWHDISTLLLWQTGRWRLLCITPRACARQTTKEHRYYHDDSSTNKKTTMRKPTEDKGLLRTEFPHFL